VGEVGSGSRLTPVRVVIALALVALGAFLAWYGWTIVDNIWVGYQDSSAATYLTYGLPLIAAGVLCLAGAVRIVRRR
jgi:TRAP-type C4-dicarboxylate transport system permease small subunit